MTANDLLFGVLPYVVVVLAVVVTVLRWRLHPFSVSSLSSQLLESRKLYWGSVPFHWGISLILVGHLAALIVPEGFELWNGDPARLYLLEITGLALAVWAGFGITVLLHRRLTNPRIRRVTRWTDLVVLAIIAAQIVTGMWIAVGYRWGSFWGTSVMVPYVRSLITLSPEPALHRPAAGRAQAPRPRLLRLRGRVPLHPPGPHHHPAPDLPLPALAAGRGQPPDACGLPPGRRRAPRALALASGRELAARRLPVG